MSKEVLLNGHFIPYEEASVSIDDRGFQFAEGIYEVFRVYNGHPFQLERHVRRMRASAGALGLELDDVLAKLAEQSLQLLWRSGLKEAAVYMQVTSGHSPRAHLRPVALEPTTLAIVNPASPPSAKVTEKGITAITVSDERWAKCYAKTTMLLPNAAAKRRAHAAGCDEALFVSDGFLMEASASNAFVVIDGVLTTAPASNYILHGVTRAVVLDLARELSLSCVEAPIPAEKIPSAEEMFTTGTTTEILPVVVVDGKTIGTGTPGPITRRLLEAYRSKVAAL